MYGETEEQVGSEQGEGLEVEGWKLGRGIENVLSKKNNTYTYIWLKIAFSRSLYILVTEPAVRFCDNFYTFWQKCINFSSNDCIYKVFAIYFTKCKHKFTLITKTLWNEMPPLDFRWQTRSWVYFGGVSKLVGIEYSLGHWLLFQTSWGRSHSKNWGLSEFLLLKGPYLLISLFPEVGKGQLWVFIFIFEDKILTYHCPEAQLLALCVYLCLAIWRHAYLITKCSTNWAFRNFQMMTLK